MSILNWISQKVLTHSSRGDFNYKNRKPITMRGGGHGQENIKYLNKNKLKYSVSTEYSNGVRLGNVDCHRDKRKKHNNKQAWFPKDWTKEDIKNAGLHVRKLKRNKNPKNQTIYTGRYKGVTVGIYCNNGKVKTVFPYYIVNKGARRMSYEK